MLTIIQMIFHFFQLTNFLYSMLEIALCNLQYTLIETVSAVSILLTSLACREFDFSYHNLFVSILFLRILNCEWSMNVEFYYYYFERSKGKGEKACIFDIYLFSVTDIWHHCTSLQWTEARDKKLFYFTKIV